MDKNTAKELLTAVKDKLVEKTPEIATGLAIGGVVLTGIFTAKATKTALELIEEAEEEKRGSLTKKEIVKVAYKPYIPVFIIGLGSIANILVLFVSENRRIAALSAAYGISQLTLTEYKDKIVEMVGAEKAEEIESEIADSIAFSGVMFPEFIRTGDGDIPFIDRYIGIRFLSSYEAVEKAHTELVSYISKNDGATINDWLEFLHIPDKYMCEMNEYNGWSAEKHNIDIHSSIISTTSAEPFEDRGVKMPCAKIVYYIQPEAFDE